jgi:hypothetical protein
LDKIVAPKLTAKHLMARKAAEIASAKRARREAAETAKTAAHAIETAALERYPNGLSRRGLNEAAIAAGAARSGDWPPV